jgi:hypothetical protein
VRAVPGARRALARLTSDAASWPASLAGVYAPGQLLPHPGPSAAFSASSFPAADAVDPLSSPLATIALAAAAASLGSAAPPAAVPAPNLPRSSLSGSGWGQAHVPLPPSWALAQAGGSSVSRHRLADRLMSADGLGNGYLLSELFESPLALDNEPAFGFAAAGVGAGAPEEALHQHLLWGNKAEEDDEYADADADADESADEGGREEEEDDEGAPSWPSPPLSHPPAASRMAPPASIHADPVRSEAVREAMRHAWRGYKAHAWGADALKPVSKTSENGMGGLGMTIVDSLDTLLLLGLRAEYDEGVDFVVASLKFDVQEDLNLFESTIRVLGGLLSAYELDKRRDPRLLRTARHVADALSFAFDSPTGIPYGTIGLRSRRKYNPSWVAGSTIAEVGTLSLEWEHLSHLTGEPKYALLARRATAALLAVEVTTDSLWPTYIHPDTGEWASSTVTLGARGDSLYEYLLKGYLLGGGTRDTRQWADAVSAKPGRGAGAGAGGGGRGRGDRHATTARPPHDVRFPSLVGNAALLAGHEGVTTASYAPPDGCKAGRAWRAAAGDPAVSDEVWAPRGSGASGGNGVDYASAAAEYEVRASAFLGRAAAGSSSSSSSSSSTRGGRGKRDTPTRSRPPRRPLPPFHPAAHIAPWAAPVTRASEAAWFTGLFGVFLRSTAGIEHQLARHTAGGRYTYVAERSGEAVVREDPTVAAREGGGEDTTSSSLPSFTHDSKVDHLVCFVPGLFALSSTVAPTRGLRRRHLALARRLMRMCMRMYSATSTGLAPEISRMSDGGEAGPIPDAGARHSLLRPETVESLFVLYRVTGDEVYREWGWQIFGALNTHARVASGGFSSIKDVTTPVGGGAGVPLSDHMESFFLAETLKYLFLLFSDGETLKLSEWVFNTEAHPLPVWRE